MNVKYFGLRSGPMLCHSLFENAISRLTLLQNYVISQNYNMKWIGTSLVQVYPELYLGRKKNSLRLKWYKAKRSMALPINKAMTTVARFTNNTRIPWKSYWIFHLSWAWWPVWSCDLDYIVILKLKRCSIFAIYLTDLLVSKNKMSHHN